MNLLVNMDSWFNKTSLSTVAVAATVSVTALIAYQWWTSETKHSTEMTATDFAAVEPSFSEETELEVISAVLLTSALAVEEVSVLEVASVELSSPSVAVEEVAVLDVDSIELPSPALAVEEVAVLEVDSIELPFPSVAIEEVSVLEVDSIELPSPALAVKDTAKKVPKKPKVDRPTRSKETTQQGNLRKERNAQRVAKIREKEQRRLEERRLWEVKEEEWRAWTRARNAAVLASKSGFQQTNASWRGDWEAAYNEGLRNSDQAEECSICIEELVYEPGIGAQLSCSHRFHTSCLKPWIENKLTCPLCRHPIW